VFEYIEEFYNRIRRHSSIGMLEPVEFERRLQVEQERASVA
jgi:transposase InsO family protein